MENKHQYPQYVAEFIGTFVMVFFGCGSMILGETSSSYDASFIPLIWGGAVSIMIYAVGHISGAHFNPAVTLAFFISKRFPSKRVLPYLFSQFLGAIFASSIHMIIWGSEHQFGGTFISLNLWGGFIVELILSFILMFVIMSVATDSRAVGELAGIAIGSTVALCAFVGGPLTNASMNPARSLAPALFSGSYSLLWVYFVATILGAALGAKAYEWIRCQRDNDSGHGCC